MNDIIPYDIDYLKSTNILPHGTRLYTKEQVQVLINKEISREREACAKVCEEYSGGIRMAEVIRQRK